MSMDFLKDFKKDLDKIGLQEGASEPPKYWYSTGNHVVNYTISGSFTRGIPQGRITGLVGPSGAGKSFIACNIIREAQQSSTTMCAPACCASRIMVKASLLVTLFVKRNKLVHTLWY